MTQRETDPGCLKEILEVSDPAAKDELLSDLGCLGTAYLCPRLSCNLFSTLDRQSNGKCARKNRALVSQVMGVNVS